MSERNLRWIVTGRVQGVGYRYFTRQAAAELGLRGGVRNLRDGSVEVEVAGDAEAIEALRERLRQGPAMARVEEIAEAPLNETIPPSRGFEIRF